jgi:hypothetical protein
MSQNPNINGSAKLKVDLLDLVEADVVTCLPGCPFRTYRTFPGRQELLSLEIDKPAPVQHGHQPSSCPSAEVNVTQ